MNVFLAGSIVLVVAGISLSVFLLYEKGKHHARVLK